eukprot:CAMPEP_0118917414 /NCGR_PEP_ID=MMETSP1166-20130328/17316_1 /TAXON_ID=1104430 /ORGANISM="Chrysoreinhardia sp, Strain CCMP3193" /LENGTH=53 /DNA_ID=CAMNT_0006857585 /DNA_START=87 /DNA_END=245 /DNA_ORIENTATION=-
MAWHERWNSRGIKGKKSVAQELQDAELTNGGRPSYAPLEARKHAKRCEQLQPD